MTSPSWPLCCAITKQADLPRRERKHPQAENAFQPFPFHAAHHKRSIDSGPCDEGGADARVFSDLCRDAAPAAGGCGLLDSKQQVGECVRTSVGIGGTDIRSAECRSGGNLMDNIGDPINTKTDGPRYDESCPQDGQPGIELKHEPPSAG